MSMKVNEVAIRNKYIEACLLPPDPNTPLAPPLYKLKLVARVPGAYTYQEAMEIIKATQLMEWHGERKTNILQRIFYLFRGE